MHRSARRPAGLLPSRPPIRWEYTSETAVQVDDDRPLKARAGVRSAPCPVRGTQRHTRLFGCARLLLVGRGGVLGVAPWSP